MKASGESLSDLRALPDGIPHHCSQLLEQTAHLGEAASRTIRELRQRLTREALDMSTALQV